MSLTFIASLGPYSLKIKKISMYVGKYVLQTQSKKRNF